ncbi:MAG TPA: 2-oxoglutarate dehydrogenase E1 component [Phototrophicaceae bacterium]|nr:2-oxoglutarate dehydrogenase E1 component [Phototrophicaceae bacterium]
MTLRNEISGLNTGYLLELYDRYQQNPASVDPSLQAFFANWTPPVDGQVEPAPSSVTATVAPAPNLDKIVGAVNYAQSIRAYGHLAAQLDPLGTPPPGDPSLDPTAHGITEDDLRQLPSSLIGGPLVETTHNALEATEALKRVYSSTMGYDYDHIRLPEEHEWLRNAAESIQFRIQCDLLYMLNELTEVEVFERFIHRIFPGKHRFSIEGLDVLVPMLDTIVATMAEQGERNILLGMAHRGRLNVLAHILDKPYKQLLAEFKDPVKPRKFRDDLGWTGDVKYHMGGSRELRENGTVDVTVRLAPNPSHLEAVNPVVEGMARAAGTDVSKGGAPIFDPKATQPILIHGDAAFPGQGIVAETLNLSALPGYWTGGTIHIITNNQLGFTTEPTDSRSTPYASDLAKGFSMPIIHVNADDPEACVMAARIACAYRRKFQKDFVIDLIGYRRYGHNEGDEPNFTQPLMYQNIDQHPTVRKLWADELVKRGAIKEDDADKLVSEKMQALQENFESLDPEKDLANYRPESPVPGTAKRVKTAVSVTRLRELNRALLTFPADFTLHPKLQRATNRRRELLDDADASVIEWATAEDLALASILEDGTAVRLTGQDSERGTYSQRHAVFHDVKTGKTFTPLANLPQATAAYEIHNSPLSEGAALGFEYGYNVQEPCRLVIWEAQYGDFDNGAQTVIDEFIVSARAKFGQTPSLVLLLPHGYEGAGPDHSSARVERFLQMAANTNIRVANATSAAQYFHLLRRQALLLETDPLPLIVLTPKSLLRNPLVASSLNELAKGHWQPVIDDAAVKPEDVRRVILCNGKIYIDLVSSKFREQNKDVALVRVEQLYPFPSDDLHPILERYTKADEILWVQEEPENMGVWEFAKPLLSELIQAPFLHYLGRPRSSSPAEGSLAAHNFNQAALIEQAFSQDVKDVAGIVIK